MPRAIVPNYDNNFGDVLAQMGALKEWKDMNPDWEIDFISPFWLHYEAAKHTDLFKRTTFLRDRDYVINLRTEYPNHGYNKLIDFKIDFGLAVRIGLKKAWGQGTLDFTPKDDMPYFLISEEEKILGGLHMEQIRGAGFRKTILIQLNTPSNYGRSVRYEDWNKILDMIPEDVALIYPCPIGFGFTHTFEKRKNLLPLPGYGIGETARLMQLADVNLLAHGGFTHLAYAVGATKTIQLMMADVGGGNLLRFDFPDSTDLSFPNNREVDFNKIKEAIQKYI